MAEKISGEGWELTFDTDAFTFRVSGDGLHALKMVKDAFPADRVERYQHDSVAADGRMFGKMFEDISDFLNQWGVNSSVSGSVGPSPETAPD